LVILDETNAFMLIAGKQHVDNHLAVSASAACA